MECEDSRRTLCRQLEEVADKLAAMNAWEAAAAAYQAAADFFPVGSFGGSLKRRALWECAVQARAGRKAKTTCGGVQLAGAVEDGPYGVVLQ